MKSVPKIVWLSNVFDQSYRTLRGEEIESCLSVNKRRDLFKAVETATGRSVIMLSSPPKAKLRRTSKWLPAVRTTFFGYPQFVCKNWDASKVRVPGSWIFYTLQALRYVGRGDVVILDNFELIYVIAAWFLKVFRGAHFVLDYEDGKHLTDRGWARSLSWLAEVLGKPLIRAAILAHPRLAERLPPSLPVELVPGFTVPGKTRAGAAAAGVVRFLYSGSLDRTRGVDLLLAALEYLPRDGWQLEITGAGELDKEVAQVTTEPRFAGRVTFHRTVPGDVFEDLIARCHVGLNCQRASDPISGVTFPSKVFTYLSAELMVISSRASEVDRVCHGACLFYDEETPSALAKAMTTVILNAPEGSLEAARGQLKSLYSIEGTAVRLARLFKTAGLA